MPLFSILRRPILLVSVIAIACTASAESYYKCKTANGRIQYSDQPSKSSDCKPIAIRSFGSSSAIPAVTTGVANKQQQSASPTPTASNTAPVSASTAAPNTTSATVDTSRSVSASTISEPPMEKSASQR